MQWCLTKNNSLNKRQIQHFSKVRMAHVLCILALLCLASCVAEDMETGHGLKDLQPQEDSLSWLDRLKDTLELTKNQNLEELLSKLSKSENGIILQGPTDTEKQKKNRRGLGGTTTQNRRSGCRFFFWKSRTAC